MVKRTGDMALKGHLQNKGPLQCVRAKDEATRQADILAKRMRVGRHAPGIHHKAPPAEPVALNWKAKK